MAKRIRREIETTRTGPAKGDFIAPPEVVDANERADALPKQEEFWRPPVRSGSVPVEKEPLVSFGRPELEPNRLFWGDNLHVMRRWERTSVWRSAL